MIQLMTVIAFIYSLMTSDWMPFVWTAVAFVVLVGIASLD